MTRELILIRHPKPDIDAGICYGQSDIPADSAHLEHVAIELKVNLPTIDRVYSSHLRRCCDLARQVFAEFKIDARISEMNFGDWELKSWDQIGQDNVDQWRANFSHFQFPSGESTYEFAQRCLDWLAEVSATTDQRIAAFTHAGVIRILTAWEAHLPVEQLITKVSETRVEIPYGSRHIILLE